ncbi:hypothetical protein L202_07817 [Cryptococcus amylolentus CBS 6039]|uniref:Uncharacterized protein n=2 Tax=Cryptococcus amylolentus TaxID=104669 RepID=A0A1E3HAD4_9TREE|nr:hypothetical protein L202_07817 [Cryptococcus amylolentus CBS 6039]ODN73264.1 hypothetical protein L202_07817 [Cryptococcus amylolentus CBS 6039]ODN99074.1 hypothetical protein I350_07229 [Cryptococcus amylolentus CBS 6273]
MCTVSSPVPSNVTTDGICCFPSEACASLICGAQNATILYGDSAYGSDFSCALNRYDNSILGTNGTDCNGVGCTWKNASASASASASSSTSAASGAMRMGGDISGVLGVWALTLCLLALVPKRFH